MREKAVLHLMFLGSLVNTAFVYRHIDEDVAALHMRAIAKDIVSVCDGELTFDDVRQEALLDV